MLRIICTGGAILLFIVTASIVPARQTWFHDPIIGVEDAILGIGIIFDQEWNSVSWEKRGPVYPYSKRWVRKYRTKTTRRRCSIGYEPPKYYHFRFTEVRTGQDDTEHSFMWKLIWRTPAYDDAHEGWEIRKLEPYGDREKDWTLLSSVCALPTELERFFTRHLPDN